MQRNSVRNENSVVDYGSLDYRKYWIGEHMRLFNEQEKEIVKAWMTDTSGWFMDLGCGFGRMVPLYAGRTGNTLLLDYAPNNLEMVRSEHPFERFTYIAADARALPLRNESIDGGICVRLLQNIPDPSAMVTELSRVLKPGGRIVLSYFNRRNLLRILRYGPRCFHRTHRLEHIATYGAMYGTHPVYFRNLFLGAGFKILVQRGAGLIYQVTGPLKLLQRLVERRQSLRRMLRAASYAADSVLGRLNLSLWQFCVIEKTNSAVTAVQPSDSGLRDVLMCPKCSATLIDTPDGFLCSNCGQPYCKKGSILDFRVILNPCPAR